MTPDAINATFESLAGIVVFLSVWRVWQDKMVRGVSWIMVLFMLTWSMWNLYYYPSLGQWNSFYGGLIIGTANLIWISSIWWFRDQKPKIPTTEQWSEHVVSACDALIKERQSMGGDRRRAAHDTTPLEILRESFKVY